MRKKKDAQNWLDFQASNLKLTNEYFARYEAISRILDESPELLDLVHRDLGRALKTGNRGRKAKCRITSEMVLRLALCQAIEGASLREIIVRVDDSRYLRRFTRIHEGPMVNHATLCKLRNAIRPQTWKRLNGVLAKAAVERGKIQGDKLRLDTTAVETNIHWPTDSSLLWDSYRTLARLIDEARGVDLEAVGKRRVHLRRAKRSATRIMRRAQAKGRKASDLKPLYERLIRQVEGICDWAAELIGKLERGAREGRYDWADTLKAKGLAMELRHFEPLARHVAWQARERVLRGCPVPNEEKLFSIFEPETELLKRGKAGKDIEFGHMVEIEQVAGGFITGYGVFETRPAEPTLVGPALANHEALFGHAPLQLTADKGYWSSKELEKIRDQIEVLGIPKKGRRNAAELEREHDPLFRMAQAFRAGIEGTISFLKRCLGLARCMTKGWVHYQATIGATVFAHNLLVLARC